MVHVGRIFNNTASMSSETVMDLKEYRVKEDAKFNII